MAEQRTARYVVAVIGLAALCVLTARADAQVSATDKACITAFTKGVNKIAQAQGKAVRDCVSAFASGQLVSMTPETCLVTDTSGKVGRATTGAVTSINAKCSVGPFPFGVTPTATAVPAAAIGEIDGVHGAVGANLDIALVPSPAIAKCQAGVVTALWKCSDSRRREYLKCQKGGLRAGVITNAATLELLCLGTGDGPQPDPTGKIVRMCGDGVNSAIARNCAGIDLAVAFPAC